MGPNSSRHAVGKADFHLKGGQLEGTLQAFLVKSRKVLTQRCVLSASSLLWVELLFTSCLLEAPMDQVALVEGRTHS